jgi:DNA-binding helix-hairpin-helix protein with protein kinase domain
MVMLASPLQPKPVALPAGTGYVLPHDVSLQTLTQIPVAACIPLCCSLLWQPAALPGMAARY